MDNENNENNGPKNDLDASEDIEQGDLENVSQDPYELSKPGTGTYHPAANESLTQFIKLVVEGLRSN